MTGGPYARWIERNRMLPWRVRQGFERWLEGSAVHCRPGVYRWLHFGRSEDPVRPLTTGPRHHFFGYYDKTPWNAEQRLVLAHEVQFNDRPPVVDDVATVGVIDLTAGNRFVPLGQTLAWNWQQGAVPQWDPRAPAERFFYNDRRDGRFCAVLRDVSGDEIGQYDQPIYALTPDGRYGFSLNFARLQCHRPGYGYAGIADPWADAHHPEADGIWRMDLAAGTSSLIVSLAELAHRDQDPTMRDVHHWINHLQVAPSGQRLAFFHIWRIGDTGWHVRLYSMDVGGGAVRCVLDTDFVSHYDWLDDERLLIWARDAGARGNFYLCDVRDGSRTTIGAGILTEDGHCSFSPDRRWVLNDTYPDRYGMRTLMLYRWADGRRIDLARLYSPKARWWGEIRCDLHPRWSRDATRVCIDSVHDGTRQIYVLDVSGITQCDAP